MHSQYMRLLFVQILLKLFIYGRVARLSTLKPVLNHGMAYVDIQ